MIKAPWLITHAPNPWRLTLTIAFPSLRAYPKGISHHLTCPVTCRVRALFLDKRITQYRLYWITGKEACPNIGLSTICHLSHSLCEFAAHTPQAATATTHIPHGLFVARVQLWQSNGCLKDEDNLCKTTARYVLSCQLTPFTGIENRPCPSHFFSKQCQKLLEIWVGGQQVARAWRSSIY